MKLAVFLFNTSELWGARIWGWLMVRWMNGLTGRDKRRFRNGYGIILNQSLVPCKMSFGPLSFWTCDSVRMGSWMVKEDRCAVIITF